VPRATGASAHHAGERVAGTSGGVRNRGGAGLAQFWQTREKSVMACLPWAGTLTVWHLMTLSVAKEKRSLVALLGLMVASLATLPLLPPIAQDPSYHQFADQRTLLGIPNFWNVVSNLPFVLVGTMGLWQFGRDRARFLLFLGVFLTGFGSAYYHWNPNNGSLFWDRLPICASMAGYSFFPALRYRYYSLRFRQDIPARLIGLSPRRCMHSPNCSNSTIMQSIQSDIS